ncbi:DUF1616 domain-containing protein [Halosimplex amylolyticum]|uniref:DUF1616 domain-containing protein n=1 Tax=Halosimplex amylolyticum TaxID=3396616 RepID=UPI003F576904
MNERGHWSIDLVAVGAATAACVAGVAAGVDGIARILVAAPLILFLPGYALVAALFPERAASGHSLMPFDEFEAASLGPSEYLRDGAGLGAEGRFALSVCCSVAVVPLVALGVDLAGLGIRLRPLLAGIAWTTALALLAAAVTRLRVDPEDRFAVAFALPRVWYTPGRNRIHEATIPNVLLVVGLVVLSTSVGYAAVAPSQSEGFTEFYVETDDMTIDSQANYPDTFSRGEESTLDVFVGNREGERADYTVVAELQRIDGGADGNGTVTVTGRQHLATRDVSVPANETKRTPLAITPDLSGENHRIVLHLYRGDSPENPSPASAYRSLRLDVTLS